MDFYFDLVPAAVTAFAGMLSWLVFFRHRLSYRVLSGGAVLAIVWVGLDQWLLPFDSTGASSDHYDLPFGSQTASLSLLAIGVTLLLRRICQGRKGFDRIFTLAFSTCILITSMLFHFVMFEHVGRQWLHDALEVSEVPLAAADANMGERCKSVLLECSIRPLESAEAYSETGTLFMFRSRDRVVLEGAEALYPLTYAFHHGRSNYMAAYHIKDGRLIELKDNIHPRIINQVMYLGLDLLSFSVGFVWIAGALYLISFHRRRLNGRRRLSAI